jgi:hypothetical protein
MTPLIGHKVTGWNYRVVRRVIHGEIQYGIHEMYYDPEGYTMNPVPVAGDSVEDLRWQLKRMLTALECPVIEAEK